MLILEKSTSQSLRGRKSELTFVKLLRGIFEISLRAGIKPDTEEKQAGRTASNRREQSGYVICVMSGFMWFFKFQLLKRIYKHPGNNRLAYMAVLAYKKVNHAKLDICLWKEEAGSFVKCSLCFTEGIP